jgi:hypothetical protein
VVSCFNLFCLLCRLADLINQLPYNVCYIYNV